MCCISVIVTCFLTITIFCGLNAVPVFHHRYNLIDYLQEDVCPLPKAVEIPLFESEEKPDSPLNRLVKPLESCIQQTPSEEPYPVCVDVYEVISSLSTCYTKSFDNIQDPVRAEVQEDVCLGFKEAAVGHLDNVDAVSPYLKNRQMCENVCAGKYKSVCQVLLWSYEIKQKLYDNKKSLLVTPFQEFLHFFKMNNCSFHEAIDIPEFADNVKRDDLLNTLAIPLKPCQQVVAYENGHALCESVFKVLYDLSSCEINSELPIKNKQKISKEVHAEVCEGFENFAPTLSDSQNDITSQLKDSMFCKMMCTEQFNAVCQILLWAHEIKLALQGESVLRKNKEPHTEENEFHVTTRNNEDVRSNVGLKNATESDDNEKLQTTAIDEPEAKVEHTVEVHSKQDSFSDSFTSEAQRTSVSYEQSDKDQPADGMQSTLSVSSRKPVQPNIGTKQDDQNVTENVKASKSSYSDELNTDNKENHVSHEERQDDKNTQESFSDDSENKVQLAVSSAKSTVTVPHKMDTIPPTATTVATSTVIDMLENEDNDDTISDLGKPGVNSFKPPKEISDFDGSSVYDTSFGLNDQKTFDSSYKKFDKSMQDQFIEQENPHFFLYFLCIVALVAGCYLVVHNKQKVIALIVEGRYERRRRSHGASYRKLESK